MDVQNSFANGALCDCVRGLLPLRAHLKLSTQRIQCVCACVCVCVFVGGLSLTRRARARVYVHRILDLQPHHTDVW